MSGKVIFKFDNVPLVFSWINGTKTINVHDAHDLQTDIDTMSFDHEKSRTTFDRANQVIIQYLKDNVFSRLCVESRTMRL